MKKTIVLGIAVLAAYVFAEMGCSSSSNNSSGTGGGSHAGGSGSGGKGSGGSATGGASTGGTSSTPASSGGTSGGGTSSGGTSSGGTPSGGTSGGSVAGANGGSATGGSSSTSTDTCGTTNGDYDENTTFGTAGKTDPYQVDQWGTWGDGTTPTLTQTTTGPSGLDCSSGCAVLTVDFSKDTTQYSGGSLVEYFGTAAESVQNLLNETVTAKIAIEVKQASGATVDVPININMFGRDAYASTTGVDNVWSYGLGAATSLDAAVGWHAVNYQVVDVGAPTWSPSRTVCASAMHGIGLTLQANSNIDDTNGAVVTLYVQSVTVGPSSAGGTGGSSGGGTGGGGTGGAPAEAKEEAAQAGDPAEVA